MDQHAGGKWLINDTKRRKDDQSNHRNSFEDRVPIDVTKGYPDIIDVQLYSYGFVHAR